MPDIVAENKEVVGPGNPPKHSQFKKGDPRINRKGRPKSFDAFRELALRIADEKVVKACRKIGIQAPNAEAEKLRVAEFILRKWAFSSNHKLQEAFTQVAYGKVPDEVHHTGTIKLEAVDVTRVSIDKLERIIQGENPELVLADTRN